MIEYDWNKLPDESRKLIAARVATSNKADSMLRAVVIQFGLTSSARRLAKSPANQGADKKCSERSERTR
jgi:hypothetical protein